MNHQANISVIITAYKRVTYIREAVTSALAQSLPPLEIIVADDSNSSEIRTLIADLDESTLRYCGNPERIGVAQNLKTAIRGSRGDFISILNDDDSWTATFLGKLVRPLLEDPSVVLTFCDHWLMNADSHIDEVATDKNSLRYRRTGLPGGIVSNAAEFAVVNNGVPLAMGAMFRKSAFDLALLVSEVEGTYDYWMTCNLVRSGKIFYVPERLTKYRIHSSSETARQSADKADCRLYVYERLLAENYFPELVSEIATFYLLTLIRCGQDRLFYGQKQAARRYLIQSLKLRPTLKALGLLLASILPSSLLASISQIRRHG